MSVSLDFSDLARFGGQLNAASKEALQLGRVAVQKTCADIKADAQAAAPVDTGNLRSSITYETSESGGGISGEVGPTAEYGIYVEYGTSTMAPQPYLGPAFDRRIGAFDQAVSQIADRI